MASQSNNDWQSSKKTVLQRNCHMFNNPLMSDISFTCGESKQKCFYAHKYVLATSSAVFYAMFFGDLAEKDTVIHLPDTDEESLEEFLRFLYTDDCTLVLESAMKVMYLAKKYIVPSLTEKCVDVLQKGLQPDNVVAVLEQAHTFDEKELEEKCWEVVDLQTNKLVTSETFADMSQQTLANLLKRDTLNVSEVELFKAVLKWSKKQCLKKGLEDTDKNRREVLGDAVYEIRFFAMSYKEFAEYVSLSGLLTAQEVVSIYNAFSGFNTSDLKWRQTKRQSQVKLKFTRFSPSEERRSWGYGGNPDCLHISVNKPVNFHGVYLFGDENGSTYQVSLRAGDKGEVSGSYTSELNDEGVYGFNVMLPKPIPLDQNKTVALTATISGPDSSAGSNGKTLVEVDGVTVTFSDAPPCTPTNGTNSRRGQFYQVIFSKHN